MIKKLLTAMAVISAMVGMAGVTPTSTVSANQAGGGNEDCPAGTIQIAKFNWVGVGEGGSYVAEGSTNGVTVSGNSTSGTFQSTTPISAVVVKGSTDAKTDTYDPAVPSGSFNNSELENNGGNTPAISNIKFCAPTSVDEKKPNTSLTYVCDTTKQAVVLTFVNTGEASSTVTVNGKDTVVSADGKAVVVEVETGTKTTLVSVAIDGVPVKDTQGEFTNRPFVCIVGRGVQTGGTKGTTPTVPVTSAGAGAATAEVQSLPVTSGSGDQAAAVIVMIASMLATVGGYALRARTGLSL
jgi:hypothetical protein